MTIRGMMFIALLIAAGCQSDKELQHSTYQIKVAPELNTSEVPARSRSAEERSERVALAQLDQNHQLGADSAIERLFPGLRKICAQLPKASKAERHTDGWEKWQTSWS